MAESALTSEGHSLDAGEIVNSQVAVGNHIVQIGSVTGGKVVFVDPQTLPKPKPRPTPVLLRGRRPEFFTNRETPLEMLQHTATKGGVAKVTGPAGMGKSLLLRNAAWQSWADVFSDGVVLENCSGLGPNDVIQRLYDAFYDTFSTSELAYRPTENEIRNALATKRALIVLDEVDWRVEQLDKVLDVIPNCAVFVGCDNAGSGTYQTIALQGLGRDHCIALFEHVMERPLNPSETSQANELFQSLEGHPLRLSQAAVGLRNRKDTIIAEMGQSHASTDDIIRKEQNPTSRRVLRILAALGGAAVSTYTVEALEPCVHPLCSSR